jgi:phenylacetate-CoA ligase
MTSPRAALYRLYWEARSRAEGLGLTHALRALRESERWERARLDQLRDEKLARLVTHAWDASPGYRRLMEERGVRPGEVRGLADLPKLPILTKELLRERAAELRFRDAGPVETVSTGGSTGVPMTVVRDLPGTVWQRACYWRGFGWGGFQLGDAYVQLFGGLLGVSSRRPSERAKAWFSGRRFLPAFELGPENVGRYLDALESSGGRVLVGYTSAIYLLATHAERAGREIRLASVFPTAEPLLDGWRETIARAFGAAVLPYYGCGEVQSLGYSCPEAPEPVYHTCDEHAVIEVEREGGGAALVGEGAFLVTDLDNHALPLLRYRNGDAGALGPPGCACGRSLGRILRVDGRVSDVLFTTAGTPISGAIGPHAFKLVGGGVQQFQIVQHVDRALTIRIVRAPGYDRPAAEARIDHIFKQHLGNDAAIRIEYVDAIPRTPAGKSRFIINEALAAGRR